MADDLFNVLEQGSLGVFHRWAHKSLLDGAPNEYGWIVRAGSWVHVDTINDDPETQLFEDDEGGGPYPTALLGRLPAATLVALEVQDRGGTVVIAGEQASTRRYRARTVAANVPLARLRSSDVRSMSAHFFGMDMFTRQGRPNEQWDYSPDKRVRGYRLTLDDSTPSMSASLTRGRTLYVSSRWSVGGTEMDRRITVPTTFAVECRRPVPVFEVLRPLVQLQDLLGLLYQGFLPAHRADLELDLRPDPRAGDRRAPCWSGPLFEPPARARTADPWPMLSLNDLGGVAGLARWIRLAEQHPRAIDPVLAPFRAGRMSSESELLTLGASIEYWVASHRRRKVKWASPRMPKRTRSHRRIMEAATLRAGKEFAAWVVDRGAWCDDFSNTYEELKHEPSSSVDAGLLHDLVDGGRYLLFGLLADRAAGSRAPTRKLYKTSQLAGAHGRFERRYAGPA